MPIKIDGNKTRAFATISDIFEFPFNFKIYFFNLLGARMYENFIV